ncbi:MAG TPA: hypothetical protein VGY55_17705 [Pirellulales bacterium]|jgi:hypothetical protein|nr:hypothetical protein [Pirellulales bacterium]
MKLPNAHLAIVEQAKVVDYLLNPVHRYGASKARFFYLFGFRVERLEVLAVALRAHGQQNEVGKTRETGFGPRYEVEGELEAPDGRRPRVRTVWQMDDGQIAPRLITAYPIEANP